MARDKKVAACRNKVWELSRYCACPSRSEQWATFEIFQGTPLFAGKTVFSKPGVSVIIGWDIDDSLS